MAVAGACRYDVLAMSDRSTTRTTTVLARDGRRLRGRLRLPATAPRGAAVVCHPHPAFGATMDVWLLPSVGVALAADGWAVLRVDFRADVGDGHAAVPDVLGAVDAVTAVAPVARVALVGWSFGALVGLLAGMRDARVTDWVGIAPPTRRLPDLPMAPPPPLVGRWAARRSVVVGDGDGFFPACDAGAVAPHAVTVVPGADHFFFDRDDEVADIVAAHLR